MKVPELLVEKLALGELSETEARAVRERLGDGADERIAAVKRSDAELLEAHPPEQIAAAVRKRMEERARTGETSRAGGWWLALPTLAAAAGLLVWVSSDRVVLEGESESGGDSEVVMLKGDPRLIVHRHRGAEASALVDGDEVRAGDLLQLSYHAGGQAEGVIVSVDGRGVVTLHHPAGPDAAVSLRAGGSVALDSAYELDDAPGYERFFFVTGDGVDVETVSKATVRLGKRDDAQTVSLALPGSWRQSSVLLRKR